MKIAVKTRESKRENDYDWEDYFPSDKDAIANASRFVRVHEGVYVDSRFAALVRSSAEAEPSVVVSVSTKRRDDVGGAGRGRPIRTMAFLRAETPEETDLLAAFFAECLRKPDAEMLYDPEGGVAKAVESLYQTKKTDEFLAFCKSLKPVDGKGDAPKNRWAIPRNDATERKLLADALPAAIAGDSPFLFALTDRLPTDVLASLGSMFDRGTIWIFSKATTAKEPIPGGPPNTRVVAAAIGGAVILAVILLVAAGRSCRKAGGGDEAGGGANIVSHSINGGEAPTSPVPHGGQGGETAGETQRDDSTTNAASTEADAMEVGKPSTPFDNLDKEKQHD